MDQSDGREHCGSKRWTTTLCPNAQPSWRLGVIFLLILDNAPSYACRLVCDHHRTASLGTVELKPLCSPNLSPLDSFVERAQYTACSASSSCRSRRIAGTFDPCVSQNVDRQSLDVRENGQGLGPQAKGFALPPQAIFSSGTDMADRIVPLKDTAQKHH